MKIEIRNLTYNTRLSEETHCFAATVYVDGAKAGTAENRGHGGATLIRPFELEQRLTQYAKTLPNKTFPESLGGGDYPQSAETLIDELVTETLIRRDLQRGLKRKVMFTKTGKTGIFQTRAMTATELAKITGEGEERARKRIADADRVLNCMPEAEALAIYRTQAGA